MYCARCTRGSQEKDFVFPQGQWMDIVVGLGWLGNLSIVSRRSDLDGECG